MVRVSTRQKQDPSSSPDARSQHLVVLLADWMSAVTLQAIFYGKSQFGIREKVSKKCDEHQLNTFNHRSKPGPPDTIRRLCRM